MVVSKIIIVVGFRPSEPEYFRFKNPEIPEAEFEELYHPIGNTVDPDDSIIEQVLSFKNGVKFSDSYSDDVCTWWLTHDISDIDGDSRIVVGCRVGTITLQEAVVKLDVPFLTDVYDFMKRILHNIQLDGFFTNQIVKVFNIQDECCCC